MGLSRKGKIGIIAKFHRTDFVICSHSTGLKTPSYSWINTVFFYGIYCLLQKFNFVCIIQKYLNEEAYKMGDIDIINCIRDLPLETYCDVILIFL